MPANVDFDSYPLPLDGDSIPILVFRYDPDFDPEAEDAEGQRYQALPNVYCRRIDRREGPDPGSAQFEYVFDDSDPESPYPYQFEHAWPLTAQGKWIVRNDDRLVVIGITAKGVGRIIFDGFAQIPQVDVTPGSQSVTFGAVGAAIRCWDTPIGGATYRNADDPDDDAADNIVETDLPTRFNPDRQPNCTPDDKDIGPVATGYPVFVDYLPVAMDQGDPKTAWTIGKAVRYLLATHNDPEAGTVWVKNPDFTNIDNVLKARTPRDGNEFYNPGDSTTYTASEITVRDYDATGKAWPVAVAELCGFAGAVIRFELSQDEDDKPVTTLKCRRGDATRSIAAKDVYLQKPTEDLDPGQTNASEIHIARDAVNLANAYEIETDPIEMEVSIVLAPGFPFVAGDESDANRKKYLLSALADADSLTRNTYRRYVASEAGDGYYDATSTLVNGPGTALDLEEIFGKPDPETGPRYVNRRRPAKRHLFSKDESGTPRRAVLCFSRDYAGPSPGLWDGTGTWQPISGGWELMKGMFGIYVSIEDPEAWDIGKYTGADPQNPGRTLRGITSQANPSATEQNTKRFTLMLTAVIENDEMLDGSAPVREASPTQYTRLRRIDCKDHFKQQIVWSPSWYRQTEPQPLQARDDREKAKAHAQSLRSATEFPTIEGTVVIPWLSNAYNLGDRIRRIDGRDVTFQTNAGPDSDEAPRYPYIVGITYDFAGDKQTTTLHYSDETAGPQRA